MSDDSGLSPVKRELLARLRRGDAATASQIPRAQPTGPVRLSFAQERVWLTSQLAGDIPAFNLVGAVRLPMAVDSAALRELVAETIARHDSLRMAVTLCDGEPMLSVAPQLPVPFTVTDRPDLADSEEDLVDYVYEIALRPYSLDQPPLWRIELVRLGPADYLLVLGLHHIIGDAATLHALLQELARPSTRPPLPTSYLDYVVWQRGQVETGAYDDQLAFWYAELAELPPPLALPTDHPRPPEPTYAGRTVQRMAPPGVSGQVLTVGREEGATAYVVALTAFAVLLSWYADVPEVLVGCQVSGRSRPELQHVAGMFVNMVPVRVRMTGDPTFRELVRRVRERAAAALAHQDVPFERLVRDLRDDSDRSYAQLVQVSCNMPVQDLEVPVGEQVPMPIAPGGSLLDLTLHVMPRRDGAIDLQLEYATALFEEATVERMAAHYQQLLAVLGGNPDTPISQLALLSDEEQRDLLTTGVAELPDEAGLWCGLAELVVRRAGVSPDVVAVESGSGGLTYGELVGAADRLAGRLVGVGVGPGRLVGICLERSVELVVAALAVWRAGGAFVPLDPEHPAQRWGVVLGDASPVAVLVGDRAAALREVVSDGCAVVEVGVVSGVDGGGVGGFDGVVVGPDDAAYVMFTSGSTGRPKGVVVTHGGIANRVCWSVMRQRLGERDRLLAKTRVGFDAAVLEWFAPLVAGGTVVLAPVGVERDPAGLVAAVADTGATVVQVVPSVLRAMVAESGWGGVGGLRQVWLAGEPLDWGLVGRLRELAPVEVWNTYGPTECSIDVTAQLVDGELVGGLVPIGRPVDGLRVVVLDGCGRLVPVGVPGELFVGGVGLARGYVGRPDLTAERFVPDPYGPAGARLYRTGDVVRWRVDGVLEFVGRRDDQVKVNGVRVEPSEVAAVLAGHPDVQQAVVVGRPGVDGAVRLVAYVVGDGSLEPSVLRQFLSGGLPAAMIPAWFVRLDELPLNDNGKLDRAALPAPEEFSAGVGSLGQLPRTPVEQAVAEVWAELLGVDQVGVHDDFFTLGGHSLLLGQLSARLRDQSGVEVSIRELFAHRSVAEQAVLLSGAGGGDAPPPVLPVSRGGRLPLSSGQQRVWFLDQLNDASSEQVVPVFVRLGGPVDPDRVRGALGALVARHEVLRTRYVVVDSQPWQVIDAPGEVSLRVVDAAEDKLGVFVEAEVAAGFDLAAGPVWRALLGLLPDGDAVLTLLVHHIASDGWSSAVLEREFVELFESEVVGRRPRLADLPVQYADYASWQQGWLAGEVLAGQLGYWREQLAGLTALELPTDRPRPPVRDSRGGVVTFEVPPELAAAVIEVGRQRGATPFTTLLTVFAVLLGRYSGQRDIAIGSPVAGRVRPELAGVVGLFINTLVLRCDLGGGLGFGELLERVRETVLDGFAHQDVPFERLVEDLQPSRDMSRNPLFDVLFDLHDEEYVGHIPGEELVEETVAARQDLGLVIRQQADGALVGMIEYAAALFDRSTVERLAGHYLRLLESITTHPDTPTTQLELLTGSERHQQLVEWNDTATIRKPGMFLDLFEALVRDCPNQVALVAGDTQLSYAELAGRANQLAQLLHRRGVGPEDVVAICLDRGPELVIGFLGVLKAGAAYVPLDPEHPPERWRVMLADTQAPVVVTQSRHAAALGEAAPVPQLSFDADLPSGESGFEDPGPPPVVIDPDSLAYVIYTSGSTGRPKGVQISHRNLVHYLWWTVEGYAAFGTGGAPLFSSVAFDMVVPNIYTPLMIGQQVHLLPQQLPVTELGQLLLERAPFSFIKLTPGHVELLCQQLTDQQLASLAALLAIGADAFPGTIADRVRSAAGDTRLLNEYGPTEITVANSIFPITGPVDRELVPIGRPIPNTTMYVLDGLGQLLPVGVVGELYIGGITVARGYRNLPDRTAERFVPDPYGEPGARMYRTGDLARLLPDGNVEFLGRVDDQIKIRGYRIEPGEVQAVLVTHPAVYEALVLARPAVAGAAADLRLVAYCVPVAGVELPTAAELADHCRQRLPEPMVPQHFVGIETIPLNENGKVDRRALPAPEPAGGAADSTAVAPRNPAEQRIMELWTELLGISVGIHQNFFQVGGHSLLAVRLASLIQEDFDVDFPLRVVFERPTVAQLAEAVEAAIRAEIDALTDNEIAARASESPPADE